MTIPIEQGGHVGRPYDVAIRLALDAGRRILQLRSGPLIKNNKPDHSLVTNADHEADRILKEGIHLAFPDHSILTEESGLLGPANAEFMWVIDPLDGTRAFARGVKGYSVMVGLLQKGEPVIGVVFDPLEDYLFAAARGQGTQVYHSNLNDVPAVTGPFPSRVSDRNDFGKMPVITSTGFPAAVEQELKQTLTCTWIPPVNSVGVKAGYVVRQLADIYINHHKVHYWDTCAPQIILEEAGGTITFLDGKPIHYDVEAGNYRHDQPTLASNSTRHRELLEIVNGTRQPLD